MNAVIISTFALILLAFGVSTIEACGVCDAAKNNQPVNGTLVPGTGANAGQVCCVSEGQTYLCQTEAAAKAKGGLINGVSNTLQSIVGIDLKNVLCQVLKTADGILNANLSLLLNICLKGVRVTCNPPVVPGTTPSNPVPTTPITPSSPFCQNQCTGGLCCTAKGC